MRVNSICTGLLITMGLLDQSAYAQDDWEETETLDFEDYDCQNNWEHRVACIRDSDCDLKFERIDTGTVAWK